MHICLDSALANIQNMILHNLSITLRFTLYKLNKSSD